MELTLIWFPILKFLISIGLAYGVYYFFKKGNNKIGIIYTVSLVIFIIFIPIKYDGTNIKEYHIQSVKQRTNQYKSVMSEANIVTTKKLSFEERMKVESERSTKANKEVKNEIVK